MAATHGVGTYGNAVGTVTPLDHKMAQLGPIVKTAANTIRAGLFWDGSATIVSGKANMSLDIRAFTAALSRGATAGAVLLTNDAVLNLTTDSNGATLVAPGSNSVYWNVFVWQREFSIDGTNSNPVISVLVGTTAASPTVPALTSFPGAVSLATVLVPAGTTATNSGTTITQTAPFTATSGSAVMVRSTTERDAGSWAQGQQVVDLSTNINYQYTGSVWTIVATTIKRSYVSAILATAVTTGATLTTIALPSIPVVSRAIFSVAGSLGFSGATQLIGVGVSVSAGTLNSGNQPVNVTTPAWAAYVRNGYIDIPASTAVTITFTASNPSGGAYFTMLASADVKLVGEF